MPASLPSWLAEIATMPPGRSVTRLIHQVKAGDADAVAQLWQRYFAQLARLALRRLPPRARRAADQEDVALSAFDSFIRGAGRGRFPDLHDRDNLWRILVVLTARKAGHLAEYEGRQKRGGLGPDDSAADGRGARVEADIGAIVSKEPTPDFAAELADECRRRLDALGDDTLREVAQLKMEGYTTEEIATRLTCVPRTVERKLKAIRAIWVQENVP
jgi:DNA-directed RNA polymerase specialized sigma24 family protein